MKYLASGSVREVNDENEDQGPAAGDGNVDPPRVVRRGRCRCTADNHRIVAPSELDATDLLNYLLLSRKRDGQREEKH